MVGHTGDIEATVVACKAADDAVKVRVRFSQMSRIFCACMLIFSESLSPLAYCLRALVADDPRCN